MIRYLSSLPVLKRVIPSIIKKLKIFDLTNVLSAYYKNKINYNKIVYTKSDSNEAYFPNFLNQDDINNLK